MILELSFVNFLFCTNKSAQKSQAMTFQTAPHTQSTSRMLGADQVGKSRFIWSFTSVFTNRLIWPFQATVAIDQMLAFCRAVKASFCLRLFSMPAHIFLLDGTLPECAGRWWGDMSQRSDAWFKKFYSNSKLKPQKT